MSSSRTPSLNDFASEWKGNTEEADDCFSQGVFGLKNPLDSLTGTIIAGLVLTIILYYVVKAIQPVGA